MKVVVITCDNCRSRIEEGKEVAVMGGEWCPSCVAGEMDLRNVPFKEWPEFVTKQAVREVLERRDRDEKALRDDLKECRREVSRLEREVEDVKRRAASALAEETDLVVALQDITSSARRRPR